MTEQTSKNSVQTKQTPEEVFRFQGPRCEEIVIRKLKQKKKTVIEIRADAIIIPKVAKKLSKALTQSLSQSKKSKVIR